MALTRRSPTATPEAPPAETTAAAPAAAPVAPPAPAPAAAPVAPPAATTAVAERPPMPVSMPSNQVAMINAGRQYMDSLKDALRVDWDTLTRIKANQGRLATADGKVVFGEWLEFELLSYQDNWLISPGKDTDEARELARYSDDGVHVKDSHETCDEYIKRLKEMDYPEARMSKRVILVASLIDCDKDVSVEEGMLFQIDMPPTSRSAFDRYKNQQAFDIAKGKIQPHMAAFIRATASVEKQRGNEKNEYTALNFSRVTKAQV